MAQKRADLIWIARPRPGADETAARLDALGLGPDFETLVSPMIALEPVSHPRPVADFRALVFTSASALDRFTPAPGDLALPVFVVGERTAAAAREAGFTDVRVGAGDSADLAALVARSAPEGDLLHPGAENPAGDMAAVLGHRLKSWAIYRTTALERPGPEVDQALKQGRLAALLVHSPSIGRASAAWLNRLCYPPPAIFALSEACAAPFRPQEGAEIYVSCFPRDQGLLNLVRDTLLSKTRQGSNGTGSAP